jgi:hypothetical protein
MINSSKLEINAEKIIPISDVNNIKAYIDFAGRDQDNNLIVIGWIFDNQSVFNSFSLVKKIILIFT